MNVSGAATPQTGIFALGTASHAYLEFDIKSGVIDKGWREVAQTALDFVRRFAKP